MESNRKIWTVFFLNAMAMPAIVYWLIANTFHLDGDSRVLLAIAVGPCGLALTVWRWWSALRRKLEEG